MGNNAFATLATGSDNNIFETQNQNENFLHMLENFSGATSPSKAVSGQLWFDSANSKLKFYLPIAFKA